MNRLSICPKCLGQMEESDEWGWSCELCPYTGEPVRIEFDFDTPLEVIRARRDSLVALEQFKLAQVEREDAFRQAERDWYRNLSVADRFWEDSRRQRVRREELERMTPMERTLATMMDGWRGDLVSQLFRDNPLLDWINGRGPKPDALDNWLTEDGPMLEVEAALDVGGGS